MYHFMCVLEVTNNKHLPKKTLLGISPSTCTKNKTIVHTGNTENADILIVESFNLFVSSTKEQSKAYLVYESPINDTFDYCIRLHRMTFPRTRFR